MAHRTPAQRIRDNVRTPKAKPDKKPKKGVNDTYFHDFARWLEKRKRDK